MRDFYGTGIEIWAEFGAVGITEKKNWADYEQLMRPVFVVKKKKEKKNIVASALKNFIKWSLKNFFFRKNLKDFFYKLRNIFNLILSCSNRDTSPRDLSIMTLANCSKWFHHPCLFLELDNYVQNSDPTSKIFWPTCVSTHFFASKQDF